MLGESTSNGDGGGVIKIKKAATLVFDRCSGVHCKRPECVRVCAVF